MVLKAAMQDMSATCLSKKIEMHCSTGSDKRGGGSHVMFCTQYVKGVFLLQFLYSGSNKFVLSKSINSLL